MKYRKTGNFRAIHILRNARELYFAKFIFTNGRRCTINVVLLFHFVVSIFANEIANRKIHEV